MTVASGVMGVEQDQRRREKEIKKPSLSSLQQALGNKPPRSWLSGSHHAKLTRGTGSTRCLLLETRKHPVVEPSSVQGEHYLVPRPTSCSTHTPDP
ncbi:hypothetical protein EYF80_021547 [Liparis tanakae]|uniref:Uncharacterized protein n=1 Tax=Liparis tanakae TaxID=230148 RepID=A0A4Z2HSG4_9TELE|nr:hypothetical protein EYF80_021547 [Liparis tanakae]